MYQIVCDGHTLHDSRSNKVRVVEPKCEMELNKTGSLTFRIPPTHPLFESLKKHKSEVSLYQDGEWVFTGRVLNDETDIFGYKTVNIEGMLGYLLDSIQRSKVYHISGNHKITQYLTDVLNIHNEQVEVSKQFAVGNVLVEDTSDQLYKISSYKDTLTTINEDLIKTFGGYFFVKVNNGVKYLDYLTVKDFPINNQIIQFGKNILSLDKLVKGENIATIIIPLGKTIEPIKGESESTNDEPKEKTNISGLPYSKDGTIIHDAGSEYIYDEEAIKQYGRITKVIEWNDVTEPSNLLEKAKEQLNYYKTDTLSLELSVFDLHLLQVDIQSIRIGQRIRVISAPHGIDCYMLVQKISLDIDQADKSYVTLITEEKPTIDVNSDSISNKTSNTDKNITSTQTMQQELNKKMDDYSAPDLSAYATINEVNSAFDELGTLIRGM